MSRFRKPGPPPPSRKTRETLLEVQQRQTIRQMLDQGGVVTPIGPNTLIRLPTGGLGTFPSAMVEDVQKGISSRSHGAPAGFGSGGDT